MEKMKKINRNTEFAKNTLILLIGKFATQFMSFLLLPLFTHYLATDDFGLVDLLQSYIFLFVPVLTLRLDSAIFRFLIDKRKDEEGKTKIISNALFVLFVVTLIAIIISIIIIVFFNFKYVFCVIVNLIVLMLSNVLLQILRGLGKNKEYSIASIITGFTCLIVNIVLILFFHYGANSILIASSIANIFVIMYVLFVSKTLSYFNINKISKKEIHSLLKYSLPMIPNSLSWWIVSVSDRTIISIFLGEAFNGIYTVSCKFSNLLNSVFSIFCMSWQESASIHINDEDRDDFFSDMINTLFIAFSCVSLIIISCLPIVYNILIGEEYLSSYNYIPILLYANSWNIMISLIGGIYIALKKTKEIANTTIISAIINLLINVVFIKYIGLYAACLSTLIAYLAMSIYRHIDCKKYINLKIDYLKIFIFTIIFGISMLLYYINNIYLNVVNLLFVLLYSCIINKELLKKGYIIVKNKLKIKAINK